MEPLVALLHMVIAIMTFSKANKTVCTLRGEPVHPELWKDGDIIVGGVFSFHSSWEIRQLTYSIMPPPLKCIRLEKAVRKYFVNTSATLNDLIIVSFEFLTFFALFFFNKS